MKTFTYPKYFLFFGIAFVTVLLVPIATAYHIDQIGPFVLSGGALVFPLAYLLADIIAEVYGYQLTRQLIWCAVLAKLMMAFLIFFLINVKHPVFWHHQKDYQVVFAHVLRFALASVFGTTIGAFADVYVFSKLRILWKGRSFWLRCFIANILGDVILTLVVYPITFFTVSDPRHILGFMLTASLIKLIYITVGSPVSSLIVNRLKKVEGEISPLTKVSLNPFKIDLDASTSRS